ncbi:uncharacterized protein LJ264_004957 [Porphyrio hochstetteri]
MQYQLALCRSGSVLGSVAGRGEEEGKRNELNPLDKSRPRARRFPPGRVPSWERNSGCGTGPSAGRAWRRQAPPEAPGSAGASLRFPSRNHHSRRREPAVVGKMTQKSWWGFIPHTSALCLLFLKWTALGRPLRYRGLWDPAAERDKGEGGEKRR